MKTPKRPPSFAKLFAALDNDLQVLFRRNEPAVREILDRANNECWNYEQCGYRTGKTGLTPDQLWLLVKLDRSSDRQVVPLAARNGAPFSFRLPPEAHRILRMIDLHLGGSVTAPMPELDTPADRARYLFSSLTEEAIASSQLEGAAVTRRDAKELLRSGRDPRTPHERMVVNNYRTVQMLNDKRRSRMSWELLREVQRQITVGTLDNPDEAGRLRRDDENIVVWDDEAREPVHTPPPAKQLPDRVEKLCAFANTSPDGLSEHGFIHPAIRAIVLHFWIGYDHPFCDGNGRTARALFYWSMLRSGYWMVEYLTISAIIRSHPKRYATAYLDTETDENDLTYFIMYHLGVIERSIREFREYLRRKQSERSRLADLLTSGTFNPRQQAILETALNDSTARFTYESHANTHGVAIATARADLLDLEKSKLLIGNRVGRRFEFVAAPDIDDRLRKLAVPRR